MANVENPILVPIGHELYRKVWEVGRLRQGLEERWFEDTLQYQGYYDSDTERNLQQKKGASKLYINMTRPKTRVLRARLVEILLPADEANWSIEATPVPRIEQALDRMADIGKADMPLQNMETSRAEEEKKVAAQAAKNMKRMMADQLVECRYGGSARQALTQACKLGVGVIKGPFASMKKRRRWKQKTGDGSWSPEAVDDLRPRFDFVDLWEFYPDMDASSMDDCEHVFQMHRLSTHQLRKLGKSGFFDPSTTRWLLEQSPDYTPDDIGHFNQNLKYIRQLENELDETQMNRFLVFEYTGPITFDQLEAMAEAFDKKDSLPVWEAEATSNPMNAVTGTIWFSADQILRFNVNPLESGDLPYSVFRIDPTANNLIGSPGVPRMLRDPQKSLNAAWRMTMESAALTGVPMFVIDRMRVSPAVGNDWTIGPGKAWISKTGFGPVEGGPPIQEVPITGDLNALLAVVNLSRQFMEEESSLPLIAQGQGDQGAAGGKQTAHGMTLLANAVNTVFRDAASQFDQDITIPNMQRLYEWNMLLTDDETVKGDMEIKALGSSVLLVNEIVSQNMLMLMNLVVGNPDAFPMLKFEDMVRLWFKTMRLEKYDLVRSEPEIEKLRQEAAAQEPQPDPADTIKLQIAQMTAEKEAHIAQLQFQTEILKLANQEKISIATIQSSLEKVSIQSRSKERLFMAEAGLKERHGEGI